MSNTPDNHRNAARAATNYLARMDYRRGQVTARVIDMSMTGARLATHEQIAIGERVVLKGYRRLRRGVNPEIEIGRFLTEVSPFAHIAALLGSLEDFGYLVRGS